MVLKVLLRKGGVGKKCLKAGRGMPFFLDSIENRGIK